MKYIQKSLAKVPVAADTPAEEKVFARVAPALHEFLTCSREGDKPRQTATWLIFCQDGLFKCFLTDRESGKQLAAAGDSFQALIAALEARITSEAPEWRQKPPWDSQKGKGKRS